MDNLSKSILEAIDIMVNERLKALKYDRTYVGKVKSITVNTCVVTINDNDTNCNIRTGLTLNVGDMVYVRAIQGDYSNKFVEFIK